MRRQPDPRSQLDERLQRDRHRQRGLESKTERKSPRRSRKKRTGVLFIAFGLFVFAALLVNQLYKIQVVAYAENAQLAAAQHYKKVTEQPSRGLILDRNGVMLAGTSYIYRIGITPKDVHSITKTISRDEIVTEFARCLNMKREDVLKGFTDEKSTYFQLKKDASKEETDALKTYRNANSIGGIRIDAEPRRFYTNSSLASQVIGYTNFDKNNLVGQLGIELSYNSILTGQPGYTYVETDNYSKGVLPFSVPTSLRAKNGQNIVLNMDSNIQKILQEELQNAIKTYEITAGGTAIVMNPYSGAILGMASYPFFDCQKPTAAPPGKDPVTWDATQKASIDYLSQNVWRNRAISDTYEPGSTFKAITASIVLEEGLSNEREILIDKPLKVFDWTIYCANRAGHGNETFQLGFYRSCNPVFAQLAIRTGVSRFYNYVRSYGFLGPTGIDLPAEGTGIFHNNPTELDMATLSYGESSTVTPIQLATAYCVFANGGNLIKPNVVKSITDSDGNIVRDFPTETIRKVVSENTTARIRDLMKGVVLYGTGSAAYVEGYSVAGKTSTSTDDFGEHTLSFAGIAPAENPEIVVLIVLNKPKDKKLTSTGAAKTVGQIVNRTMEYMGITREYSEQDISRLTIKTMVPSVTGMSFKEARLLLAGKGFSVEAGDSAMSDATLVKSQYPEVNTEMNKKSLVILYPVANPQTSWVAVPDFSGKNINEALRAAAEGGLNLKINGSCLGIIALQSPLPTFDAPDNPLGGSAIGRVRRGSLITVRFETTSE